MFTSLLDRLSSQEIVISILYWTHVVVVILSTTERSLEGPENILLLGIVLFVQAGLSGNWVLVQSCNAH